jgi:hypothetical protein
MVLSQISLGESKMSEQITATEQTAVAEVSFSVENIQPDRARVFGGGNEDVDTRSARMVQYLRHADNRKFVKVGKLLSQGNYAQIVADGGKIGVPETMTVDHVTLPMAPGQVISLETLNPDKGGWGCPACKSAHGSGVYPSKGVTVKGLAQNTFYYNVATRKLFSISNTCLDTYFEGAAAKHFTKAQAVKA